MIEVSIFSQLCQHPGARNLIKRAKSNKMFGSSFGLNYSVPSKKKHIKIKDLRIKSISLLTQAKSP